MGIFGQTALLFDLAKQTSLSRLSTYVQSRAIPLQPVRPLPVRVDRHDTKRWPATLMPHTLSALPLCCFFNLRGQVEVQCDDKPLTERTEQELDQLGALFKEAIDEDCSLRVSVCICLCVVHVYSHMCV